MNILRIENATRTLGKSQGYLGLPIRDENIKCSVNGPDTPSMVTAWEPTPSEIEHIKAGGTVYLRVLGSSHPAVMLWAEPPKEST